MTQNLGLALNAVISFPSHVSQTEFLWQQMDINMKRTKRREEQESSVMGVLEKFMHLSEPARWS